MGLFDFLTNTGNAIKNKIGSIGQDPFQQYAQNMPALQLPTQNTGAAAPMVQGLQLSPDGSSIEQVNTQPMNTAPAGNAGLITRAKSGIKNFNLGDALLGKAANPTDNIGDLNGETISAGVSSNPRVGGLFNDITAGARENFNNRFDVSNFANKTGSDGRQKGFAYRIGEGLGTLGRFMESPLGRMALTAGIVGATGGSGLQALAYGGTAGVTNQQLRSADQLYRQQLKDNYGFTDEQLNNVRGYVSKDDFNTLATNAYRNQSLQVRQAIAGAQDNTKRANLIMQGLNNGTISPEEAKLHMVNYGITFDDLSKSNASRNADMNEELLPYKKYALQMTPQIAMGNLGVAQGNLALNTARFEHQLDQDNKPDVKLSAQQKDAQSTLSQIGTIRELVGQNPTATGLVQGYTPGDIVNRIDKNPDNIKTRTAIDALRTKVRHDLTGAQFSPKEAREYEKFLPTTKDTPKIIMAKLDALEKRYYADFGVSLMGQNQGNNTNNGGWAF